MNPTIILWNPFQNCENRLKDTFIKKINNPAYDVFFIGSITSNPIILTSPKDLDNADISNAKAIFVLAELTWDNRKYTDYYGLELVRQWRLKGYRFPVFICSFVPEKYFIEKQHFYLGRYPGHYFIQLPDPYTEEAPIEPVDPMDLFDIQTHYCNLEGIIRDIYHMKADVIGKDLEEAKKIICDLINEIHQLPFLPDNLKPIVLKVKEDVDKVKNKDELAVFLKADDSIILQYLRDENGTPPSTTMNPEGQWKILLLEDKKEHVSNIIEKLKNVGFIDDQIIHIITVEEAKQKIQDDKGNKIVLCVVDFRLEPPQKTGKMQQGYKFIEWLSKQGRINEIFVYSGLSRKYIRDHFNKFNIRVHPLSKYDTNIDEMVNTIVEKGNEAYKAVESMPKEKKWEIFETYYKRYRSHTDYEKFEKEISSQSINIIKKLSVFMQLPKGTKKDKENPFIIFGGIKNLNKELPKLNNDNTFNDNLSFLKDKLIARRIAWWMIKYGFHSNTIYNFIQNGILKNYYEEKIEKDINKKIEKIKNLIEKDICDLLKNPIISNHQNLPILLKKIKEKINDQNSLNILYEDYYEKINSYKVNGNDDVNKNIISLIERIKIDTNEDLIKLINKKNESLRNGTPETSNFKTLINTNLLINKENFPDQILVEEKNWFKYDMGIDIYNYMDDFHKYFIGFFEEYLNDVDEKDCFNKYFVNKSNTFSFKSSQEIFEIIELFLQHIHEDKKDCFKENLYHYALECYRLNEPLNKSNFAELLLNKLK